VNAVSELPSLTHGLSARQRALLAVLWRILPQARLVGGVVRDLLADRRVADIDMAIPLAPEQVMERLRAAGVVAVPTGLAHGTVTAVVDGLPCEITTLRRDVQTDGRHAVVAWTDDWQLDAARRDFTINALFLDQAGRLYDWFGGQADLRAGRVRFVGDAQSRIEEDALRILRFFRFQARYGTAEPVSDTVTVISRGAALLAGLSVERVWAELKQILALPQVMPTVRLMAHTGVLAVIMPEGVTLPRLEALEACQPSADPLLRLAALTQASAALATRLKLSRAETGRLRCIARLGAPDGPLARLEDNEHAGNALRSLLVDAPKDCMTAGLWLCQAQNPPQSARAKACIHLRQRLSGLDVPVFPLAGRDALAMGVAPGPDMGRLIAQVRRWWQQGGCVASAKACRAELARILRAEP
jgi:poly(A) polymerase